MADEQVPDVVEDIVRDLPAQEEENLNTESSQNDFSLSVPNLPAIQQICSGVAEHIDRDEEDLIIFMTW